jgi:hypothetical protein
MEESVSVFTESYLGWFRSKVSLLSDFSVWCDDVQICRQGGSALLPRTLSQKIAPVISEARKVVDIPRPNLNSPEGQEQWHTMVFSILLGTAGELTIPSRRRGSLYTSQFVALHHPLPIH